MRIAAAMSGGVDSAVAAALLVDAGHDVTGIHLALSRDPRSHSVGGRGCCSLEDVHDARRAADVVGIPFYVWDLSERFHDEIVEPFVAEYAAGRTPNPCLLCNDRLKFDAVLARARALGFDALATGHYARLESGADGVRLRRAADPAKDQSYVLGGLVQAQLRHSLFPLGGMPKAAVRDEARRRGLLVADKPDSTDICFIPDGDTGAFLEGFIGRRPGSIVDESGAQVGAHEGAYRFTVGQRHGLRLPRPAADGRPRYVTAVDVETNTVRVGPRTGLAVQRLSCVRPTWTGVPRAGAWQALVQVRAHAPAVPGTVIPGESGLEIATDEPLVGVAPGQRAVLYDGDVVVGAATIARTAP